MRSAKQIGRTVGVLSLAHLITGLIVPFVILDTVRRGGFLENAAGHSVQLRTAVFLLFAGSAMAIGIAVSILPVLRRYSNGMAYWLLALAIAGFSLQSVDNGALLSMLSLSQEYAQAGAAKADLFTSLALVVGAARKWAHYSYLLVVGTWILLLCSSLYRFKLVPRALAALGMIGSVLQITGVTLRGLLGYAPETRLAIPLAPAYVALAVWLMVKGINERHALQGEPADA